MSVKAEVDRLKANAQKSFDAGMYGNAREDWYKAANIDKTDHESWWGIVRCEMKENKFINEFRNETKSAYAYAPADVRKRYEAEVKNHNDPLKKRYIEIQEIEKRQSFNNTVSVFFVFFAIVCLIIAATTSNANAANERMFGAIAGIISIPSIVLAIYFFRKK